jgi:Tol biopolymer transport system component
MGIGFHRTAARRALLSAMVLAALAAVSLVAPPTGASATAPSVARPTPPVGWTAVTFGNAQLFVPNSWPVFDTSADPAVCVRVDRHAVYLGGGGLLQHCPAHLVGRTESVQIQALDARATSSLVFGPTTSISGQRTRTAVMGSDPADLTVAFPDLGVLVRATYGRSRRIAEAIIGSVTKAAAPRPMPVSPVDVLPSGPAIAASGGAIRAAGAFATASNYVGPGFDACTAPDLAAMSAWRVSAYHAVGIYIGGAQRACSQANLNAAWITSVELMGWNLMPLYVGPQAPCVKQSGIAHISSTTPSAQGVAAADDAVIQAGLLGLGVGSPVYYDMEAYDNTITACDQTVEKFLSAWTSELHKKGYVSGVYGSSGSTMAQLVKYVGTSYQNPDDIWLANWGVRPTSVFDDPYIPNSLWANHQRIHQYQGGHGETYGGVAINIDSSWVDGAVVGKPADGSFVRTLVPSYYRVAGGSPFRVLDCSSFGRCRPVETLSTLKNLARYPADGTVITGVNTPNIYVVAGHAALKVEACPALINPKCAKPVALEQTVINALGYGHLLRTPVNGTQLQDSTTLAYWLLENGCRLLRPTSTFAVAVPETTILPLFPLCKGTLAMDFGPNGNHHIFLLNADGLYRRQVTSGPADDRAAALSPDGTKVAFDRTVGSNTDIYVVNIDGTGLRRLTTFPGFDGYPSWSPDNLTIAFQSDRANNTDIYTMSPTGTHVVRLTTKRSNDRHPFWTPVLGGTTIAFDSDRSGRFDIWTMTSIGTRQRQLTTGAGSDERPAFSPNGAQLAFQSNRSGNWDIWIVNSDGTGRSQVTRATSTDVYPSWSPDGERIGFLSDRGGGGSQIYMMHTDGSWVFRYSSGSAQAGGVRWSVI